MSRESRYSLTRVCLSKGQISCTQSLASFFPAKDNLKAVDTTTGNTFDLKSEHTKKDRPRIIEGLGDFFRHHKLQVNDTIYFQYDSEKDLVQITPKRVYKKIDFNDPKALSSLQEVVVKSPKPLSENDIHGLYPDLPHDLDLNKLFRQDNRILKVDGRWQSVSLRPAKEASKKESSKREAPKQVAQQVEEEAILVGGPQESASAGTANPATGTSSDASAQLQSPIQSPNLQSPNQALGDDANKRIEAFHNDANDTPANNPNSNLGSQTLRESISKNRPAFFAPNTTEPEAKRVAGMGSGMQEISSSISGLSQSGFSQSGLTKGATANVPETSFTEAKPIEFTGDYAALHKQAREKLEPLGFNVSSIEQGQLLIKADMGRANYSVLMYLLPDANGLNWPSVLVQRRKADVNYLCILGNSNDLLKVDNSASFLRASMWSWQALDKIVEINKHMDVGPVELEPCFRDTGLELPQVEVFQSLLNEHLQNVGLFSQIIQSIAARKAPSIFVLDDIMTEVNAPRETVATTLKTLSQVPFNLIQTTENHEFVIGKDITTGLKRLENYSQSLRANLPESLGVERIPAAPDEPSELL